MTNIKTNIKTNIRSINTRGFLTTKLFSSNVDIIDKNTNDGLAIENSNLLQKKIDTKKVKSTKNSKNSKKSENLENSTNSLNTINLKDSKKPENVKAKAKKIKLQSVYEISESDAR